MQVYIRLFDDRIVGNPKGYKSIKSANIALSRKYKGWKMLRYYIWSEFDIACNNGHIRSTVYSIGK